MSGSVSPAEVSARRRPALLAALAIAVALDLALLIGVVLLARGAGASADSFDGRAWYAVFLDDKEAFVGHINNLTGATITMDHLYYLTFEAKDANGNPLPSPKPEDFKPTLKKLGQEIWGPEDLVRIDRVKVE